MVAERGYRIIQNNTRVGELSSGVATRPFERIFINHVSQFPRSTKHNNYILTIVDAFTKYVLLIPVKNTKSLTTVNALTTHVFSLFGFPKYLVSDNVPHFCSQQIEDMCLEFGIKHAYTTPYYPNPSLTESVNKNLKVAQRVYQNQNQQTWDQNIHWFQLAFNAAFHQSVSATLASLFFKRELQTPLDLQWNLTELTSDNANSPDVHDRWASTLKSEQGQRKANEKRLYQLQHVS